MPVYRNVMESLVEEKVDKILHTLDCCQCDQCRNDIVAYALNQLPTKYVVTQQGEAYSKIYVLSVQHDADILAAITAGANLVREHPRHTK